MNRRTQGLSARELEVLDLVRVGLTNDEIAERLNITSDGVKYHVSQILAKLGVSSRHDAVAVAYGETRGRWWSAVHAWTLLRMGAAITAMAAVAFVALLLWGAFESHDSENVPDVSSMTPTDVYAAAARGATRPGQVLHSRVEGTVLRSSEGMVPEYSLEMWVDATTETLRAEFQVPPGQCAAPCASTSAAIVSGQYLYYAITGSDRALRYDSSTCPGTELAWLSVLFSCLSKWPGTAPGPVGDPHVETGEFHGRRAVDLVYVHETPGGYTSTWRTFLDAESYLPIGSSYIQSLGGSDLVHVEATYENGFIPLDKVRTLLDPHSIGYGVKD